MGTTEFNEIYIWAHMSGNALFSLDSYKHLHGHATERNFVISQSKYLPPPEILFLGVALAL